MQTLPMICVHDVQASSRWYQAVLGARSGHGGAEYEQIVIGERIVLQLHRWEAHEHPHLGNPALRPYGNGVALWFESEAFDADVLRVQATAAEVLEPPHVNPLAQHRELWLRDPDGYVVVISSRYGDLGRGR